MQRHFLTIGAIMLLITGALLAQVETSSAATTQFSQYMEIGMTSSQVRLLQTVLAKDPAVYPEARITSYFGPLTKQAVLRFQKKYGIDQLGVVGPSTRATLNAIVLGQTDISPQSTPAPEQSSISSSFEVSGWIPYWAKEKGVAEARAHIDQLTEINPFAYTVKSDSTLFDAMKIKEMPWTPLLDEARAKKVRIIPSVLWTDAEAMHQTFISTAKRTALINSIVATINENNFDGIDLDFEAKYAKTKPFFSLFLKELYVATGNKWVMCTIEPRTPMEARYDTIPDDIQYANDFVAINAYCDRVRIMTYDQGTIDLALNRAGTDPYIPIADPVWVEKVVNLAAQTIAKNKLVIGVTTYGYEYKITPLTTGYRYARQSSLSYDYAVNIANGLNITPVRNRAGELSFAYIPTDDPTVVQPVNGKITKLASLTGALATALPQHLIWWSDATAVSQKVDLARKLGVRGVAVFKLDGGADPKVWDVLK